MLGFHVSQPETGNQILPAQLQGFRTEANENTTAGVENGKHGQISWDKQNRWRFIS